MNFSSLADKISLHTDSKKVEIILWKIKWKLPFKMLQQRVLLLMSKQGQQYMKH